jgi:hypothetical protein
MMRNLSDWLHKLSTGRATLIALVIFLLFIALVLPKQAANADAGGAGSPDLSLIYSAGDLYRMAEAYGPAGRTNYIRVRFTFDLIWPVVYVAFLATAISWLSRQAFTPQSLWQRANLIPIIVTLLDYLENVAAALVIGRYPARTPVVDVLAPVFTFLKWSFVGGSFTILIIALVAAIWAQARGPR